MIGKQLKSIAQSIGFLFFVILAGYGLYAFITGPIAPAASASGSAEIAQQGAVPVIPQLVNYQGYLLDGNGQTLDGTHNITFRIYDSPDPGATALHEETHATVRVRNGYFAVLLGDQAGKPLPAGIFANKDRYIGITVAPHPEMTPRQRFAAVAYAFSAANAANADLLDGKDSTQYAPFNSLAAADHAPAQAIVVDNDGRVGIGTTAPDTDYDLDIVDPDQDGRGLMRLAGGGGSLELWADSSNSYIRGRGPRHLRFSTNATERMIINGTSGYVGLGTSTPGSRLDVNGDINTRGRFLIDGVRPIIIKEVRPKQRTATTITGVSAAYRCGVLDFRSYGGDIYEYGPSPTDVELMNIDTWIEGNLNKIWVDFRTHNKEESWIVEVICFHRDLIQ